MKKESLRAGLHSFQYSCLHSNTRHMAGERRTFLRVYMCTLVHLRRLTFSCEQHLSQRTREGLRPDILHNSLQTRSYWDLLSYQKAVSARREFIASDASALQLFLDRKQGAAEPVIEPVQTSHA